jgi:hypothetical protein
MIVLVSSWGLALQDPEPPATPAAPPAQETSRSITAQAELRAGLWVIPDFHATVATGSREFTRGSLFDLGVDVSFAYSPWFLTLSGDYAFSAELAVVGGSLQAGIEVELGELFVPLTLRPSAGVLFATLDVDEPRFGEFKAGVGFLLRVELAGRVAKSLTASIWADFRNVEFDFKPTVVGGDNSAGGATFAVGLSLAYRF